MIKIFLLLLSLNSFATDVYIKVPPEGGGGGGVVSSVNSQTGAVVLTKTDLGLPLVVNKLQVAVGEKIVMPEDAGFGLGYCFTESGTDTCMTSPSDGYLDFYANSVHTARIENGQMSVTGAGIFTGDITANNFSTALINGKLDKFWGFNEDIIPNNGSGITKTYENYYVRPLQNSPNESITIHSSYVEYDPDSSGFSMVSTGNAITMQNLQYSHQGTGDLGALSMFNTSVNIGNGTDPISLNGYGIFFGFGNFNDNVTINGTVQGYGFQTLASASVTMNSNVNPFYDFSNWLGQINSYQSYTANPTVGIISNNNNMVSYGANPSVTTFQGNANYTGLALNGNFGSFGTGSYNGIQINPNVTSVNYAQGLFIDMSNVTATTKYALVTNGDAQINGGLTFSGALSVGQLNAYASYSAVDGGGTPGSVHSLISAIEVSGAGIIANADTFGINTAALMTMQPGSSFTSGGLGIGLAALGLPAVLETHTGSTGDYVGGALFAISLSGASTGGHVDTMYGGRWLAIPNGITTVDRHYNGWFQMPFGTIATDSWGIYQSDSEKNWFEGGVKIGGTTITSDFPTSGMELDVEGDAYVQGALSVGSSTSAISLFATGSATLDFPSTSANTGSDLTMSVTGAIDGDICSVGFKDAVNQFPDTHYICWVSASNVVTVRFLNVGANNHNPPSDSFKVLVTHF